MQIFRSTTTIPLFAALAAVLALLSAGCGGGDARTAGLPVPDAARATDGPASAASEDAIAPQGLTLAGTGGAEFSLRRVDALGREQLEPDGLALELGAADATRLTIAADQLAPRHSLYLQIGYDPDRVHPAGVQLAGELVDAAVMLSVTAEPGLIQLGIASIGAEPRLAGDIALADIEFAPGAFAGETVRQARLAPKVGVDDLAFHEIGEQTLTWTYNGNGDYDQNGETTIGDITPVGLYFNAAFGGFNWDKARVADGDNNGEVNVGDITPIGVSFGAVVQRFQILVANDAEGPFMESVEDPVEFAAGVPDSPGGPRLYQVRLESPWPNYYYVVVPSDGTELSQANGNALLYNPVNQPPTVSITPYPQQDEYFPGITIQFEASAFDFDGSIISWEWDLDGDGVFTPTSPGESPQYQTFYAPGVYHPAFRATDNLGASQRIRLSPALVVGYGHAESYAGSVGTNTANWISAENVNGRLGMAYLNEDLGKLCYLQAVFIDGELGLWDSEQQLATASQDCSLAVVDARPAISFFDQGLYFTRAVDPDATSFGAPVFVNEGAIGDRAGISNFMTYFNDNPYIVCVDSSGDPNGGDIWTNRAIDFAGTAWPYLFQAGVDGEAEGRAPSAADTDNTPVVIYQDDAAGGGSTLYLLRSIDPFGDFMDLKQEVVAGEDAVLSEDNSLLYYDGRLLVVYWSRLDGVLRCIQTSNQVFTEWYDPVDIATAPHNDGHYSLALVGGNPAVAYFTGGPTPDTGYWGLKYIHATTESANFWSIPQPLYEDPDVRCPSLADIEFRPVVAHQAGADRHLQVSYFAPGA